MSEALVQQAYVNGSSAAQDIYIWHVSGSGTAEAGKKQTAYYDFGQLTFASAFSTAYTFWLHGSFMAESNAVLAQNVESLSLNANSEYSIVGDGSWGGIKVISTSTTIKVSEWVYHSGSSGYRTSSGTANALVLIYLI